MAGGQFVTHKSNDARHDLMKKILYDLPPRTLPQMSEGDRERHQAIMRAYKIHKQEQEELKRQERERKFACIQRAREELRLADPRLFKAASRMESNLTFPRQMRAPLHTAQ
ncbi:hypothetical protein EV182_003367 [Spiromyces aspiralis]|uniref:Uncharacterized protein n=1 Tax=Spiromyces aspiralis TaxID=68401 RepID=A0ACC1HSP5_9FUNG|nr:hypothetical protein EV182_003367 [Spiromyces aspiralis]